VAAASDPRELAREILNERRFHRASIPHPLRGVFKWIGDRAHALSHGINDFVQSIASALSVGPWVAWVLLGLLVAGVAIVLARIAVRRAQGGAAAREAATAQGPSASQLQRDADAAERAGRYADALRLRFGAGLLTLAQRGVIERRASLRSAEVAATLGSERFDALSHAFDEVVYGGRPALEPDAVAARTGWSDVLAKERG
jgi:amino acid transporter